MNKLILLTNTRSKAVIGGVASLLVAYGLASLAIDKANLFAYFFTFVFIYVSILFFHRAIKINGKRQKK